MPTKILGYGFKLTDQDGYTRRGASGETRWAPGVERTTDGKGDLCGAGFTHFYSDPFVAAIFNASHAHIRNPRVWLIAYGGEVRDDRGRKAGASFVKVIEEVPVLTPTTNQRVAFAILCALEVCQVPAWREWAENWLAGDRSVEVARSAYRNSAAFVASDAAFAAYASSAAFAAAYAASAAFAASAYAAVDFPALAAWALTFGED